MALTIGTPVRRTVYGNRRIVFADVTFDSAYADNGESLVATDFGLTTIDAVTPCGLAVKSDGSDAVAVSWDATNKKLLAFWGNNDAGSDSGFIEVANNTDLSAYTVRLQVTGN